jgi:iron complex transport system substrate-binding protein
MRMRRAAAVFVLLLGCQQPAEQPQPQPRREPAAPRVVSLHDVTTEMLVELGALPRVVGIAEPVDPAPELARAVAAIPRVGGLESILAARPDAVLGLGVVAERDPELVARLREAGVEVYLANPAVLDDVYALTRAVAQRADAAARGEQLISELQARVARASAPAGARKRVFVYDCCDPPFTAGRKTVLQDLIARAGGHNVFGDLDADWTHVSWEEVVTRKPELIVVHAYRYDGQGDVADKRKALAAIPSLAGLPVVVLPLACSLGGLRSAEGLERLRAAIEGRS